MMRQKFFLLFPCFLLSVCTALPVSADPLQATDTANRSASVPEHHAPLPQEQMPNLAAAPAAAGEQPLPLPADAVPGDEVARFCRNIDNRAQDAHYELQERALRTLRTEVEERLERLERKRREVEDWMSRRDAFLARTRDSFVGIIAKMQPAAAAAQIELVDEMAAASIILKLQPRIASAIMNEMQPDKSASLMRVLVSAQKGPAGKASGGVMTTAKAVKTPPE